MATHFLLAHLYGSGSIEALDSLFDHEHKQLGTSLLWVRLPGLSMQIWSEDFFRLIGNDLGQYLEYDKSYLETRIMTYARILVSMDTHEGLVENLILNYRGNIRNQILEYEGVPFRCR